jgi:4-hydroxy-2-oxoheptanedioate aldolase
LVFNPFKQALGQRRRLFGFWSALPYSLIAEIIGLSQFDFVLLDMEHAPNDARSLMAQLQALKGSPVHPVVRVPGHDPVFLNMALDIGFRTLLVPKVEQASEARQIVSATRYPPSGTRGMSRYHRNNLFGALADYYDQVDAGVCILCQVETPRAIERIREIAAVPGVDALFVGPGDLAASLGHLREPAHPAVQQAIARAAAEAAAAGKPIGIVAADPEQALGLERLGYGFMTVGADIPVFKKGVDEIARRLKVTT